MCRPGAFEKASSCSTFTPEWDSTLQHIEQQGAVSFTECFNVDVFVTEGG
jgi:hypothetical protein